MKNKGGLVEGVEAGGGERVKESERRGRGKTGGKRGVKVSERKVGGGRQEKKKNEETGKGECWNWRGDVSKGGERKKRKG